MAADIRYVDLDDLLTLRQLDSAGALEHTANYPRQLEAGWELAQKWGGLPSGEIRQILVLATGGGSAASVHLLKSYLFDELPVPVSLNQGYHIPAWVDRHTLVVAVSHSGNTEEILASYEQACAAGVPLAVITAGGKLRDRARENGHPLVVIPGGMMPRLALGYIFLPLLGLVQKLGLVEDKTSEVEEAAGLLRQLTGRYGPEVPARDNPAKTIALEMDGYIPVIYGTLPLTEAVACRWKNQMGENSKLLAWYNVLPALHHDEAAGWEAPTSYLRHFYFVFLRDAEDGAQIRRRLDLSRDLLRHRAAGVREVYSQGRSRLARLFSLIYLGDWVSLYLALARGLDPTPVPVIELLKRRLAGE
ncbi:MAG: bifunctional phosphoglucose/phosphomannose isomerase [Moorellaceae bacterium]